MSKITMASPFVSLSGRLHSGDNTSFRVRNGRVETYCVRHPRREPPTEAEIRSRQRLVDAHQQAKQEMDNPERLAFWTEKYKVACENHRRHPNAYANRRADKLRAEGKRIRPSVLVFPSSLRTFIISSILHGETD